MQMASTLVKLICPFNLARKVGGHEFIIGRTAHSIDEAKQAVRDGADFLELVHVIQAPPNSSKSLLQKLSFGMFLKRYDYRSLPLVALHLTTLTGLFIWE